MPRMWNGAKPMKRLLRILLNTATALSLILFLASLAVCTISQWRAITLNYSVYFAEARGSSDVRFTRYHNFHARPDGLQYHTASKGQEPPGWTASFTPAVSSSSYQQWHGLGVLGVHASFDDRWLGRNHWERTVFVSYVVLACITFILPGGRLILLFIKRKQKRANPHACKDCGYDLRATPTRCPECGRMTDWK